MAKDKSELALMQCRYAHNVRIGEALIHSKLSENPIEHWEAVMMAIIICLNLAAASAALQASDEEFHPQLPDDEGVRHGPTIH